MKYYMRNSYEILQAGADCCDCMICPQKLYLDITEDCNLYCRMCRDERSVSGKTMPMELFMRTVDETSPYVRCYSLFNWGEPLILSDFRERVKYVNSKKRRDCTVEISTNGMLLNKGMADFLRDEGVTVIISVDGADKATFEGIRRGSVFETVMDNAKYAAEAYRAFPIDRSPSFYVSIQKDNRDQVYEIAKNAHSLGIRRFGCGVVTSPAAFAAEQDDALRKELERTVSFIDAQGMFLEAFPAKISDYVFDGGEFRSAKDYIVSTTCNAPLLSATIGYNGDVYLCCNVGARVGNIAQGGFLELWRSARYDELRRAVNDEALMPRYCKHCMWFNRN